MKIPVQRVWRRFERILKDGSVQKFRIQDVPPNMYEESWQFVKKYFFPDEPFSIIHRTCDDPVAMEETKNYWNKYALPQNVSLLCVEDIEHQSKPEIIGINYLRIGEKGEDETPCKNYLKTFSTFVTFMGDFNVYEHFGVSKYLGGVGIAMDPKYRGMNIGLEILLARKPLCEHYGIKLTDAAFTAKSSQILAEKAGYTTVFEKTYEELGRQANVEIPKEFKVCKYMIKFYD